MDSLQHTTLLPTDKRHITGQVSLGVWLAWFWLTFGNGMCNPSQGKGYLVVGVAVAMLIATILCVIVASKPARFELLTKKRFVTLGVGFVWGACSLILALSTKTILPDFASILFAGIGASGAVWLLLLIGKQSAHDDVIQSFISFLVSLLVTFFVYFFSYSLPGLAGIIVYALLPCICAFLLYLLSPQSKATPQSEATQNNKPTAKQTNLTCENPPVTNTTGMLDSEEARVHFVELIIGLAIFFFTISFVRSTGLEQITGPQDFHLGATPAMAIMGAYALIGILFAIRGRLSLNFIRTCYTFAALGLAFATMTMALTGVGNEFVRTITDTAYLALFPAIWCAIVASVFIHHKSVAFAFGTTFATIAASSALGWTAQNLINLVYGSQNAHTTILLGLGFLCFAYFMFGFPVTSYSAYLMRKEDLPIDMTEFEQTMMRSGISFREAASQVANDTKLSKREREVFFLLIKGWSNERIAEDLVVSYHTVRAHVRNIYAKLEVHNRQEMLEKIDAVRASSWADDQNA